MAQSSNINLYDCNSKDAHLNMPPSSPNSVRGWLMGVHGYRDSQPNTSIKEEVQGGNDTEMIPDGDGYSPIERRKSMSSIASEDSVNLDDLIKANFTLDVDDETDLPNLASLDLDDSKEDFWKTDKELSEYKSIIKPLPKEDYLSSTHPAAMKELDFIGSINKVDEEKYNIFISNHHRHLDSPELSWSPPDDDHLETLTPSNHRHHHPQHLQPLQQPLQQQQQQQQQQNHHHHPHYYSSSSSPQHQHQLHHQLHHHHQHHNATSVSRPRSGSVNSDNSSNSYSTVTVQQYSRYGMTPMIYQSDSTSTSSRTPSRLSNYSTSSQTSSNTTTGIPRARKVSATSTGMPSPSRSFTSRAAEESHMLPRTHSRLGTSHLPSSSGGGSSPASSTSSSGNHRSKLAQRASHIPSPSSQNNNSHGNNNNKLPRLSSIPSSSKSTGAPGARSASRLGDHASVTSRKVTSRASHIPSIYERSTSPISGRVSSSGVRNSVFGFRRESEETGSINNNNTRRTNGNSIRSNEPSRVGAPLGGKSSSGLRPPGDARSSSRIGVRKL